jgi:hypothetical protein
MTTEQKAEAYDLLKITISTYLESYSETLIEFESGLEDYKTLKMDSMIELKKEHVDLYKGKVEILTELNK